MAETNRDRKAELAAMTAEELEQRLRETFFYPDKIDETVYLELEALREALEEKRPPEAGYTAEESWARFLEDQADELEGILPPALRETAAAKAADDGRAPDPHTAEGAGSTVPPDPERSPRHFAPTPAKRGPGLSRRFSPAVLRRALIAAVITVLLAGAALAADYAGLWAWGLRWNTAEGRYAPVVRGDVAEGTVLAALAEMKITEPVYPTRLPEGFVITESRISRDPLVLMEQYAKGDKRLTVTITPLKGFETSLYQQGGESAREYRSGRSVHYMFRSEGTITAVWCTDHYAASVSGNLSLNDIKGIIDSVYAPSEGGHLS